MIPALFIREYEIIFNRRRYIMSLQPVKSSLHEGDNNLKRPESAESWKIKNK
jgi:hypothetical protein